MATGDFRGMRFAGGDYRVSDTVFADGMNLSTLPDELKRAQENGFDAEGMAITNIQADGLEKRAADDANAAAWRSRIANETAVEVADIQSQAAIEASNKATQGAMGGMIAKAGFSLLGLGLSDETTKNTIEDIEDANPFPIKSCLISPN